MIESLNNSEKYVNKIINLFFYDYEIEEDQMEILSNELDTIEHVAKLFEEKKFIDEDKFQDFNLMFQYMVKAFLVNDTETDPNTLYLISCLIDLKEFDFAIWLITSGPLCSKENVSDERAMLFRWIVSDSELLSTFNIEKINSLILMTDKFDFEHFYNDEHFNMHIEDNIFIKFNEMDKSTFKKLINSIDLLLITIYNKNFIRKHIENINSEKYKIIDNQREILLNKKKMIIEGYNNINKPEEEDEEDEEDEEIQSLSGDTEPYNSSDSEDEYDDSKKRKLQTDSESESDDEEHNNKKPKL